MMARLSGRRGRRAVHKTEKAARSTTLEEREDTENLPKERTAAGFKAGIFVHPFLKRQNKAGRKNSVQTQKSNVQKSSIKLFGSKVNRPAGLKLLPRRGR